MSKRNSWRRYHSCRHLLGYFPDPEGAIMTAKEIRAKWKILSPCEKNAWIDQVVMKLDICANPEHGDYDGWCRRCQKRRATRRVEDISAAWQVVEKMRKPTANKTTERFCLLLQDIVIDRCAIETCDFISREFPEFLLSMRPDDICLAALLAMKAKE